VAVRSRRDGAGRAKRPRQSPGVRRGVRLVHGADLPGRALLRPEFGHLVGADAVDDRAGLAQAEGSTAKGGAAGVRGAVGGGDAGGVLH